MKYLCGSDYGKTELGMHVGKMAAPQQTDKLIDKIWCMLCDGLKVIFYWTFFLLLCVFISLEIVYTIRFFFVFGQKWNELLITSIRVLLFIYWCFVCTR